MNDIVVIAHNIRSVHNVGSIFRTCEGFGVTKLILSGYTPYPSIPHDTRLPHIAAKLTKELHKTALGAETMLDFEYHIDPPLTTLRQAGYSIIGLEQGPSSVRLQDIAVPQKTALILGEEVTGISDELQNQCDELVEIPMHGQKESFNVSVATGIALYGLSLNT